MERKFSVVMEYKKLGNTNRDVSTIGLGCEHLDRKPYEVVKETVDSALRNGINIFDVFMPGKEVRENVAKALGNRRKDILVQGHIGATDVNQQYDISRDMPTVKKYFEDLLRIFGGHIEFGMLFFIDSEQNYRDVFETDFVKYAETLKKSGDIAHIGFSSHNPVMAMKAINTGVPEMLMFSINPAFDMLPVEKNSLDFLDDDHTLTSELFRGIDPKRAELYKLCEQKQVGITVMKTLGAGKLISKEHTPFASPMTVPQCIHYALTRPAVSSALLGFQSDAQILDAMKYFDTSDEDRDYSDVINSYKKDFRGSCVYCSHCQPCPANIDIAAVHKYLDIAKLDVKNIPPSIRSHYNDLDAKGDACIKCEHCESRCPFDVPIVANMAEAEVLF